MGIADVTPTPPLGTNFALLCALASLDLLTAWSDGCKKIEEILSPEEVCLVSPLDARHCILPDASEEGNAFLVSLFILAPLSFAIAHVGLTSILAFMALACSFGGVGVCPRECPLPFGLRADAAFAWASSLGGSGGVASTLLTCLFRGLALLAEPSPGKCPAIVECYFGKGEQIHYFCGAWMHHWDHGGLLLETETDLLVSR